MYTIKTLNAISPVGLAKLPKNQFDVTVDADAPDGILVRSADLLNTTFNDNLLAIARAGAGVNNIPLERCSEQGIVVFNTPGANANAVAELVIGMLIAGSRNVGWDVTTKRRKPCSRPFRSTAAKVPTCNSTTATSWPRWARSSWPKSIGKRRSKGVTTTPTRSSNGSAA